MGNGNQTDKVKNPWIPDLKIQAFKEIVTAVLGVLVLGFTLYIAYYTFEYVGQKDKMTDAKDVLLLMLGLAGVVIGYYFGRVPADARAAQAQVQANAATAQTEQVNAQVQTTADKVEQVMNKISPVAAATRGISSSQMDADVAMDLQRIRDDLRSLTTMSRVHK